MRNLKHPHAYQGVKYRSQLLYIRGRARNLEIQFSPPLSVIQARANRQCRLLKTSSFPTLRVGMHTHKTTTNTKRPKDRV